MNIKWFFVTLVYLSILTIGSLQPGSINSEKSSLMQMAHNLMHVPAYCVVTLLISFCFKVVSQSIRFVIVCFPLFFGIAMEVGQASIPYRYASFSDVGLNFLGIVVAVIVIGNNYFNLMSKKL